MLLSLVLCGACFLIFCAVGIGFLGILYKEEPCWQLQDYALCGILLAGIFGGIWSLFGGVSILALVVFIFFGLLLLATNRAHFKIAIRTQIVRLTSLSRVQKFALAALWIVGLAIASSGINDFDTGLYHTQSIKWIAEYGVVPGLGNLHGRFAFNSMAFPLQALFSFRFGGAIVYPTNTILVLLLLSYFLRICLEPKANLLSKIYSLVVIFGGLFYFGNLMSSPQPDVLVGCVVFYLFDLLLKRGFVLSKPTVVLVVGLVLFCTVVKLSTVFLLLLLVPIVFKNWSARTWLALGTLGVLIYAPFLIRNYILSGWLVYPFAGLDLFAPDWKIPIAAVIEEKQWVVSWARNKFAKPAEVAAVPLLQWFGTWWQNLKTIDAALVVANLLVVFAWPRWWRHNKTKLALHSVVLANLIFWFFAAPDPRFARGFLIVGLAFGVQAIFSWRTKKAYSTAKFKWIVLLVALAAAGNTTRFLGVFAKNPNVFLRPPDLFSPELRISRNHFRMLVPEDGDRCYDADLPCAPNPKPNLVPRGEGLADGFRVSSTID